MSRLLAALLGLIAVVPPAAGAELQAIRLAATDAGFSRPHDLVLSPDGRFLYVADLGNHVVKVLDPHSLATLGSIGGGELASPHDVAFDPQGRLLVADTGNDRVAIYAVSGVEGELVGEWREELGSPEGVASDPASRIYIANAALDSLVVVADGRVVARFAAELARPHDVDLDGEGTVYLVDPGNDRIQLLDRELRLVGSLGGAGFDFDEPKYLAFDAAGRLYVADEYNDQIKVFDAERRLIATIGSGERGAGPDQLNKPEGVAVRGELVWISDTYNDRILRYRLAPQ